MNKQSYFFVLDGVDGSGTTTHTKLLAGYLENKGYKVYVTQEPTKSDIGLLLRKILKDTEIPPTTDALLFAADRDFHYNIEIKKKLDEGFIVISDRYIEASIVYQCTQSEDISVEWIKLINKFVGKPDLMIILDINPEISLLRKKNNELEKFENIEFLKKVRDFFIKRAKKKNYNIVNSDDIIEFTQEKIQNIVMEYIKKDNTNRNNNN
ncbi:MAG: dTMP kinase [Candidatus Lokiarchaeota archaeon]|nr:dTMP kinase [Candidatus Lokiarchaeota archaeon]